MDRPALLLYLQNIRDLEVTKYRIYSKWEKEKQHYQREMAKCDVKPSYQDKPEFEYVGAGCLFYFFIIEAIGLSLGIFVMASMKASGWTAFMVIGALFFWILVLINKPVNRKDQESIYQSQVNDVEEYNKRQDDIVQEATIKYNELLHQRNELAKKYKSSYDHVNGVLNQFYSMNILPSQYRNVASAIYIYDYMSSSQASLEDTLVHEHMENGIQRIQSRLNQMMRRLDDVIYETRCIRDDNRANIEQVITKNNQMLKELQSAAISTQDAAQYAELAANYSKANAYFSLANYFKG